MTLATSETRCSANFSNALLPNSRNPPDHQVNCVMAILQGDQNTANMAARSAFTLFCRHGAVRSQSGFAKSFSTPEPAASASPTVSKSAV
jgi:hypothetical protein